MLQWMKENSTCRCIDRIAENIFATGYGVIYNLIEEKLF